MSLQIILKNSSVSGKEPTASQLANGELALNYHADGPFISCKDSAGTVRRIAGVWISTTAPTSPTPGEFWLDTNTDPAKLKVYKDGTDTWIDTITVVAASTTAAGVVELATDAETQAGTDTLRAVTPASLQSKVSDSTSTTSSTTIASSTAVKSAKDVADAALPAAGGTISGNLTVSGDLTVNGTTTTIDTTTLIVEDKNIEMGAVDTPTDVTADGGGITLKGATDKTLNWVDSTDSWTSSENVDLATGKTYKIAGTDVLSATALGSAVQISSANIPSGTIVNDDVNASAAIAGTKIDPDFGSQNTITTGTSTAASFIPSSSTAPTNGLYLPSANNVAVATGGSGRLFVDSLGNVGFNATPEQTANRTVLTLNGSGGNEIRLNTGGTQTMALVCGTDLGVVRAPTASGVLRFDTGGTNQRLRITSTGTLMHLGAGDSTTPAVQFNGSAPVDSLVVNSSGRLGVGTASPGASVHTTGALRVQSDVELADSGNTVRGYIFGTSSGNTYRVVGTTSHIWQYNGGLSEAARIDGSGRLGIGTNAPSSLLTLNAASNPTLRIEVSNTQYVGLSADTGSAATFLDSYENYPLAFSVSSGGGRTERARIDTSGRLGLGTDSPGSFNSTGDNLVVSSSGDTGITINAGTSDSSNIYFSDSDGNTQGQIRYFHSSDQLSFGVNSADALRITSTGNVGVGTNAPGQKLDVIAGSSDNVNYAVSGRINGGTRTYTNAAGYFVNTDTGTGASYGIYTTGTDHGVFSNGGKNYFAGYVGINTATNPSTTLHIEKDTGSGTVGDYPEIRLDNDDQYGRSSLSFYDGSTKKYDIFCYNDDGDLRFRTNAAESGRLTGDGRLLIGTGAATSAGSTNYAKFYLKGDSSSANNAAPLVLWKGSTPAVNDRLGRIIFAAGSTGAPGAWIDTYADEEWFTSGDTTDQPTRLSIAVCQNGDANPTNRFAIDNYGRLNTFSSSNAAMIVGSNQAASTSAYIFLGRYAATGLDTGVSCYAVYTNGTYAQLSDVNLKKNIESTRDGYLDDLNRLRVVKYNWASQEDDEPKELGLIAQEVEQVFPGLVSELDDDNPYKGIKTGVLPYMLLKALQEATAKIEALEARVAALEGN